VRVRETEQSNLAIHNPEAQSDISEDLAIGEEE
jgi:hypothetical protein